MKGKNGFSLVELLTVVIIIAVLTTLVLPNVSEYLHQSKISKAKGDLDEIVRAIVIYENQENRDFPGDVFTLMGRYLNNERVPVDPWGLPYDFSSATEVGGGVVFSRGEDRTPGTSDDIVFSYKPPLALMTVQWNDNNRDGLPSGSYPGFPATDSMVFRFNRSVDIQTVASLTIGSFIFSNAGWIGANAPFLNNASSTEITPSLGIPKFFNFPFTSGGIHSGLSIGLDNVRVNGTVRDKIGVAAIPADIYIQAK